MFKDYNEKLVQVIKENTDSELLYVMVIGGNSYYLSKDNSDIDLLAITLPNLTELSFYKNTRNSQKCYTVEGKVIDVKYTDLRTFLYQLSKGNRSNVLELANLSTDKEFILFEKDKNLTESILNILSNNMCKDFWFSYFKSMEGELINLQKNKEKLLTPKKIANLKMLMEYVNHFLDKDVFSNKFGSEILNQLIDTKYNLKESDLLTELNNTEKELNSLKVKFENDNTLEVSKSLMESLENELATLVVKQVLSAN